MAGIFTLPNVKEIRAEVIRDHLPPGTERVVCLSCGNASAALARAITAVPVVRVDPAGPLVVTAELSIDDQHRLFGRAAVNATSGYLPLDWVEIIGQRLFSLIPEPDGRVFIPCGSGETLLALSFFIPLSRLVAVTATYPPIDMMGPLARWIRRNVEVRHAGRVRSVKEALSIVAGGSGLALCWE